MYPIISDDHLDIQSIVPSSGYADGLKPSTLFLIEEKLVEIGETLKLLTLQNKLLKLKILSLEGKFTQEEVANIKMMLMSEDDASVNLANTIIENA
jgi:hypothetical protein